MIDGVIEVDAQPGASDDAKLDAAMAAEATGTYSKTLRLSSRKWVFRKPRLLRTGLKITGAGEGAGVTQIRTGNPFATMVRLELPAGESWWRPPAGQTFGVSLANLAMQGNGSCGVIGGSTGVLWESLLHNLSATEMTHVLGERSRKLLIDGLTCSGPWNINNARGTSIHIGGSDNRGLWTSGHVFIDTPADHVDKVKEHVWLDWLEKSTVSSLYITAEGPVLGLRISGNDSAGGLLVHGVTVEGRNKDVPAYGAVVRHEGGRTVFVGCDFNFGMAKPAATGRTGEGGVVTVTGGRARFIGCTYRRAVPEAVPFLAVASAARAQVVAQDTADDGGTFTGLARVKASAANVILDPSVTRV